MLSMSLVRLCLSVLMLVPGMAPLHSRAASSPAAVFVLDLDGDGLAFSSSREGVVFELLPGSGRARIAWTARGTDDSLLTLDRNGNGRIDDGGEILGSSWGRREGIDATGFESLVLVQGLTLAQLRTQPLPKGIATIDAQDPAYSKLRLWTDADHDGASDAGELRSLPEAKVWTILLSFQRQNIVDRHGNRISLLGSFVTSPGTTRRQMAYVEFAGDGF